MDTRNMKISTFCHIHVGSDARQISYAALT
jgi:hypothetical protein